MSHVLAHCPWSVIQKSCKHAMHLVTCDPGCTNWHLSPKLINIGSFIYLYIYENFWQKKIKINLQLGMLQFLQ
jgi:hypothetical protein